MKNLNYLVLLILSITFFITSNSQNLYKTKSKNNKLENKFNFSSDINNYNKKDIIQVEFHYLNYAVTTKDSGVLKSLFKMFNQLNMGIVFNYNEVEKIYKENTQPDYNQVEPIYQQFKSQLGPLLKQRKDVTLDNLFVFCVLFTSYMQNRKNITKENNNISNIKKNFLTKYPLCFLFKKTDSFGDYEINEIVEGINDKSKAISDFNDHKVFPQITSNEFIKFKHINDICVLVERDDHYLVVILKPKQNYNLQFEKDTFFNKNK